MDYDSCDEWPAKDKDSTSPMDPLFISTCQVLRDMRVVKLNERVRQLELQLFYKDYNSEHLFAAANQANFGTCCAPKCACKTCFLAGRGNDEGEDYDQDQKSCSFAPWFTKLVQDCGLTIAHSTDVTFKQNKIFGSVVVSDAHLVTHGQEEVQHGWRHVFFGLGFVHAKSIHDPELKKLWFLFRLLETFRIDYEREEILQRAKQHAERADARLHSECGMKMEKVLSDGVSRVDLKPFMRAMDLPEDAWRNVLFLEIMEAQGVQLCVHLLTNNDDDVDVQGKVHKLIKPCVEDFYQRRDFEVEMLDAAYFVVTLSRVHKGEEDVVGCVVGFWQPYPDNIVELRFEAVRRGLLGPLGAFPSTKFKCFNEMLLSGLHWAVFYLARNDPYIMINIGKEQRTVSIHAYLDLDAKLGQSVWGQEELEEAEYEHVHDKQGERLMEKELFFK